MDHHQRSAFANNPVIDEHSIGIYKTFLNRIHIGAQRIGRRWFDGLGKDRWNQGQQENQNDLFHGAGIIQATMSYELLAASQDLVMVFSLRRRILELI